MSVFKARTVVQAIEEAASSTKTGFRFIEESSEAEPFFTHGGIERASARYGGALKQEISQERVLAAFEAGWRRDVTAILTGDGARVVVTFGLQPI